MALDVASRKLELLLQAIESKSKTRLPRSLVSGSYSPGAGSGTKSRDPGEVVENWGARFTPHVTFMACAWPDPVSCSNALSYDRVNQPEIRRKLTDCPLQVDPVPCDKSQILLLQKVYSGSPSLWLRLQHSLYRNSMRLALSSAFGPFAVDDSYVHKKCRIELSRN